MATAYAHRVQQSAGHVFGPYPSSLVGCIPHHHHTHHQRPRHHHQEEDEDECENDEESVSACSDEDMALEPVATSSNDWQQADDRQLQPRQPATLPPPPIVVTYGPFHSPDVDVAEAYGQMVCYLWFWSPPSKSPSSFDSSASALQLQPQPHFIHFLSKVITQTQLSKTVLVLALHYLWLLKRPVMAGAAGRHEANMGPVNAPSELATARVGQGSQYTVSVIALMLANKFMDDNTYTNKSWASICGVTLERINAMEREFLKAINHSLHVDVNRFMSWIRIMQSFFVQRQSRFDSRARPRQAVPLPRHYQPHLLASGEHGYAPPPTRSAVYTRARSVSPGPFQFTFVPPNAPSSRNTNDTHNSVPSSSLTGRSWHAQRPVTQHTPYSQEQQHQQRPVTSIPHESYGTPSTWQSHAAQQQQPLQQQQQTTTAQWVDPSAATSTSGSGHDPLFISIPGSLERTRSKRSASQAFSPQSAEPPRPRPDERIQQQHHHHHHPHHLVHPNPVHANKRGKPMLVSYPNHHHVAGQRRIHHVHEVLASRPTTAVEINFSRMSLSSHGPSPVSDEDVRSRSAAAAGVAGGYPPSQPPHGAAYPHLIAPFDPYTAPSFRNEGSREGEPLELQYYQLVQGGRGVIRAQPSVAIPHSHVEYVYREDISPSEGEYMRRNRLDSFGTSSSAPGSASKEGRTRYPTSATFSTDDEEGGMSGSESSNGTGWEHPYPHPSRAAPVSSLLQPGHRQPSSHVGGGYSLPPLSTLLAETSRFASPTSVHSSHARPSPHENNNSVKYAEFANAGPPASYGPQWGFQVPSSLSSSSIREQVQYPPLQTVFHSSTGVRMEPSPHSDLGYGQPRQRSSLCLPSSSFSSHSYAPGPSHRHAHVQLSPAYAPNAFTPQFTYQGR